MIVIAAVAVTVAVAALLPLLSLIACGGDGGTDNANPEPLPPWCRAPYERGTEPACLDPE